MLTGAVEKKSEGKIYLILCVIFCLPLFFINIKDSHDWGDDFAQYILQARNIVEKKPQTETGYVYDETLPVVAPPAYPAGFPLMLAGIIAWKGISFKAFSYLITSMLFLLCMTLFLFLRKNFSGLASLLLVLIFAYNPWTLGCKMEVLSDIPFSLFLLLAAMLYLYARNSLLNSLLIGITSGIMLSIRGVGIVFLVAFIIHNLYLIFKSIKTRQLYRSYVERMFITIGSACAVYFLLNHILVSVPAGKFLEFYSSTYKNNLIGDVIVRNLNYYTAVFEEYFHPHVEKWEFVTYVSKAFALVLLLIGLLYAMFHKRSFIGVLTWTYILLFIFYPYSFGGFRFILPIFPFLIYYMATGLKQVNINIPLRRKTLIIIGGMFVLLQYRPALTKYIEVQDRTMHGPQETTAVETFQYIRQHVPEQDIVVFTKPKAMALFSNRRTFSTVNGQTPDDVKNMLNRLNAKYLVMSNDNDVHDVVLENYLAKYPESVQLIWKNDAFFLYKYN